jgi:hypothetical protein
LINIFFLGIKHAHCNDNEPVDLGFTFIGFGVVPMLLLAVFDPKGAAVLKELLPNSAIVFEILLSPD